MKASCSSLRLVKCECVLSCFPNQLVKGACLWKVSCRSWRLVMSECVSSCFSECVLTRESVSIESVLYFLASCCERMRLVVFFERVLTRERSYGKRLVGLGVLL